MLRCDRLHPHYGGNKWYKLQGFLDVFEKCRRRKAEQKDYHLIAPGGAYSNFVGALAAFACEQGLSVDFIIRADRNAPLTPVLERACELGHRLHFVSRSDFRKFNLSDRSKKPSVKESDAELRPNADQFKLLAGVLGFDLPEQGSLVIPEGGSGYRGSLGAELLYHHCRAFALREELTNVQVFHAVGTGSTAAGFVRAMSADNSKDKRRIGKIHTVPVLKHGESIVCSALSSANIDFGSRTDIRCLYEVHDGYHFGGFAKRTPELDDYQRQFELANGLMLDRVYLNKLVYAYQDLQTRSKGFGGRSCDPRAPVLLIHSGLETSESIAAEGEHANSAPLCAKNGRSSC